MDNDEVRYNRYISGDDNGLVEIIKDYKDGLLLYLNSITGNLTLAEEYMEEAFFRIAVKKPVFRKKSSFRTWLYSIARNIAVDEMRKRRRISDASVEEYTEIIDNTDIELEYIHQEQKKSVHTALKKLSEDYRQVLVLTYFEDFTIDETAVIMKKNKKQINNLLYRAKKSLRIILEEGGFEYEKL
ncbi:MAG: RNA polymerase sigma factor [Ruminococcus sp.]|nr:RNA polymerase sigma factor [Ruminococcus sp.]